ncbi:MAG: HAD family hydrolase [Paludibacteraceae bacterium]|nr:HAD family hydrolase [Paludibacteraceae bacterium]
MKQLTIQDLPLEGIKAIVFDLDGTLYDNKYLPLRLIFGDIKNARLLASERNIRRMLKGLNFGNPDAFYNNMFEHIARRQNMPFMDARDWYFGKYMPLMINVLKKHYHAGEFAEPLLKQLRGKGIVTAVFSDYRNVEDKLNALGLDPDLFDYHFAAPDLGGLKPNKQLFLNILKELGVDAQQALMIGDREDTDGAGARNVGMKFLKV